MKPLRIYLGDLTYDTVTISAESTPLNIGYVAAYCKKQFGDDIEISLKAFKRALVFLCFLLTNLFFLFIYTPKLKI